MPTLMTATNQPVSLSPTPSGYEECLVEAWPNADFVQGVLAQLRCYLTTVDAQVKAPEDNPTIGLLLCKSRYRIVAKYALRDTNKPMGVAEYQLTEALPKELESSLPSIEAIERELGELE